MYIPTTVVDERVPPVVRPRIEQLRPGRFFLLPDGRLAYFGPVTTEEIDAHYITVAIMGTPYLKREQVDWGTRVNPVDVEIRIIKDSEVW